MSIVAENVLWQVVQLVVTQVPVRNSSNILACFNSFLSSYDLLEISVSNGFQRINCQVFRAQKKLYSAVIVHILQNISFCDSSLPRRSHEVPPYCLALFLFCDPAGMDIV